MFKSSKIELQPDVKVINATLNTDYSFSIKDLVYCIDLRYDSVFLIIQDDIF